MLCQFQVYSKVIQLYIYIHTFFFEEPPFSFTDLYYCFLPLYFIYFWSGLYAFFPFIFL